MPIPEYTPPPPFPEYDVADVGTVIAHEGDSYICRTADGRVIGWRAQTGTPDETTAAADFTWSAANPRTAAPHRVLKDTIVQRVKSAGKLADLAALVATLPADQRFEFDQSTWFSSDNAQLVGGCAALGLDPAVILAADPLAPKS